MITISKFKECPPNIAARVEITIEANSKDAIDDLKTKKKTIYLNLLRYIISLLGKDYYKAHIKTTYFPIGPVKHTYIQSLTSLIIDDDFNLNMIGAKTTDIYVYDNEDINEQVYGSRNLEAKKESTIKSLSKKETKENTEISKKYLKLGSMRVIVPKSHFVMTQSIHNGKSKLQKTRKSQIKDGLHHAKKDWIKSKRWKRIKCKITSISKLIKLMLLVREARIIPQSDRKGKATEEYPLQVIRDIRGHPMSTEDINRMESCLSTRDKANSTGRVILMDKSRSSATNLHVETHRKKIEKAIKNGEVQMSDQVEVVKIEGTDTRFYVINGNLKLLTKFKNYKHPKMKINDHTWTVYDITLEELKLCASLTNGIKRAKNPINLNYRSKFTKSIIRSCKLLCMTYDQVGFNISYIHNCCWRTFDLIYFVRDVLYQFK